MVKVVPEPERKEQVAVKRVLDGGQQDRAAFKVGMGEQEAPDEGKNDGKPVSEDNVDIGEEQGIDRDEQQRSFLKSFSYR